MPPKVSPSKKTIHSDKPLVIHRSRLVKPLALCINHIAICPNVKYMAVLRNFARMRQALNKLKIPVCAVEIYKLYNQRDGLAKRTRMIHDTEAIQAIAWFDNDTIITVSMNQTINLYDIVSGRRIFQLITDFGPIFCLRHEPRVSKLFVGTEFGYVCSYECDYVDKSLLFDRKMVKIPTRILSIDIQVKSSREPGQEKAMKSDKTNIRIVGGTLGKAIVWDYDGQSIEETLTLGTEKSTIVWSVLILNTGEIVTGDSTGTTSIFDPESLTCKQQLRLHTADILCLAKTENDNEIYISGIDHTIRSIERSSTKRDIWTSKSIRHVHTHDVRSLAVVGNEQLYSGGSDTFLTYTRFPDPTKRRFVIKPRDLYQISNAGELLIQSEAGITIWTLAVHEASQAEILSRAHSTDNPTVQDAEPTNLVSVTTRYFVVSSCFNSDWLCYYTNGSKRLTIYRRLSDSLVKVRLAMRLHNVSMMRVTGDAKRSILFAVTNEALQFIELNESVVDGTTSRSSTVITDIELDSIPVKIHYDESLDMLILYCESKDNNKLVIFNLQDHLPNEQHSIDLGAHILADFIFVNRKPKMNLREKRSSRSPVKNSKTSNSTIYAYTFDDEIMFIDMNKKSIDSIEKIEGIPEHTEIIGLLNHGDNLVVYDDQQVYKISFTFEVVKTLKRYSYIQKIFEIPKSEQSTSSSTLPEWLVIELPHQKLLSSLPPPLDKKKYGTR